jgi:hypothetical protein
MKSAASISAPAYGKGLNLSENCLKVLEKRYLKRNEDGTVTETAVDMFTRVARTIAEADRAYGKSDAEVERTAAAGSAVFAVVPIPDAYTSRKILVAQINDVPGAMHGLLVALTAARINVEDCYGFVVEEGKKAAIVFEVEKAPEAEQALKGTGIHLLTDAEIYRL